MKARDVFAAALGRSAIGAVVSVAALIALALPAAASAAPPAVFLAPVTNHSITTAQVSGEITVDSEANGGFETFWCFEATPAGQEAWVVGTCGVAAAGASEPITGELVGLSAGQVYEARIFYLNFTTPSPNTRNREGPSPPTPRRSPPTFVLGSAENISYTTAHISGTSNPEGGNEDAVAGPIPITGQLEVNREGQGWNPVGSPLTVEGADAVSSEDFELEADAAGLAGGTEYKFRLSAHCAGVAVASGEGELTTQPVAKPFITSFAATPTHFSAMVNPNAPKSAGELEGGSPEEEAINTAWATH